MIKYIVVGLLVAVTGVFGYRHRKAISSGSLKGYNAAKTWLQN